MTTTVSIIGCGWLGFPLAKCLLADGYMVRGSATSAEKVRELTQHGIDAHQLQLNPEPIGDLSSLSQADTLIINVPPKAGKMGDTFHPEQIQALIAVIRQSEVKHVIYVSSTSVYPELSRTVIEEDVTTETESAAPMLVQAEQLVQSLSPERLVTILRYGGLMGYDRIPGKYVAGETVDTGAVPVNYLHRDDAVGILQTVINQEIPGVFNAVAPEHPMREAVYRRSCADFGYALPTFVIPNEPVPYKVVSANKLLNETAYHFQHPNPLSFLYKR